MNPRPRIQAPPETSVSIDPSVVTLCLDNVGNPDHRQDPSRRLPGVPAKNVPVKTLEEAGRAARAYIEEHDLGMGNYLPAKIMLGNKALAVVSYNGKAWTADPMGRKALAEVEFQSAISGVSGKAMPLHSTGGNAAALSALAMIPPTRAVSPLLSHPAYSVAVKFKGYDRPRTPRAMLTASDCGKALIRNHPAWTKEDHLRLAGEHIAAAKVHMDQWSKVADEAATDLWGRPFEATDYRISAIGSDQFREDFKERLRYHARTSSDHKILASGHEAAAKVRNLYAHKGETLEAFRASLPEYRRQEAYRFVSRAYDVVKGTYLVRDKEPDDMALETVDQWAKYLALDKPKGEPNRSLLVRLDEQVFLAHYEGIDLDRPVLFATIINKEDKETEPSSFLIDGANRLRKAFLERKPLKIHVLDEAATHSIEKR